MQLDSSGHQNALSKWQDPTLIIRKRGFNFATMQMDKPAPCVQTAFKNETSMRCLLTKMFERMRRFFHMTNAMAAALVTFPPKYPFAGTDKDIGQQIGNCIPPKWANTFFKHVRRTGMGGSPPDVPVAVAAAA